MLPGAALLLAVAVVIPLAAQEAAVFVPGSVTVAGVVHPYQLLQPKPPAGVRLPLLVFLHGAGERGNDNQRQLTWLCRDLSTAASQRRHPCFLLAVQCPADARWCEVDWAAKQSSPMAETPTPALRAVLAAMDQVLAAQPVDLDRVYLSGLSMGGYGSWELACRQPERFAALLPVCGGGDERQAARLASLPVWAWHGAEDRAVPVERSRQMVAAITAAGGAPRYSELPQVGHDVWRQAYGQDGALDWLFAQDRGRQGRRPGALPWTLLPLPAAAPTVAAVTPAWPKAVAVHATAGLETAAALLVAELQALGTRGVVTDDADTACVRLRLEPGLDADWRLRAGTTIEVAGRDRRGVLHGLAALLQLHAGGGPLPAEWIGTRPQLACRLPAGADLPAACRLAFLCHVDTLVLDPYQAVTEAERDRAAQLGILLRVDGDFAAVLPTPTGDGYAVTLPPAARPLVLDLAAPGAATAGLAATLPAFVEAVTSPDGRTGPSYLARRQALQRLLAPAPGPARR